MVPLLDLVNCRSGDGATVHSTGAEEALGGAASTKAGRAFAAGEQVWEDYGQPNSMYFTYHGFSLANNSHDCFHGPK